MPIRIGTENIGDIYVGTERIAEVYVGTELVYQRVTANEITGHTFDVATDGTITQVVSGSAGATYTTTLVAGTQTIPAGGSNTHTDTTNAVTACSGNSGSATIAAVAPTVIAAGVTLTLSDSNAMTGAGGTFVDRGTALSTRTSDGNCNAATSYTDNNNRCQETRTENGTFVRTSFATYAVRRNCDNTQTGSVEEQTGTTDINCTATATNTAYIDPSQTTTADVPGTESTRMETITDMGTCGGGTETAGCCPDADCTATDGTRTETYTLSAQTINTRTTRDCDGMEISTGTREIQAEETGLTRDVTCSYTYDNPDTCADFRSLTCSVTGYPSVAPIYGTFSSASITANHGGDNQGQAANVIAFGGTPGTTAPASAFTFPAAGVNFMNGNCEDILSAGYVRQMLVSTAGIGVVDTGDEVGGTFTVGGACTP